MDDKDKPQAIKQLCTVRIGFPCETDEQAIEYKKKIAAVLADIPNVRIDFGLTTLQPPPPPEENA